MIEKAGLSVPENLAEAARKGSGEKFYNARGANVGKYFVAG